MSRRADQVQVTLIPSTCDGDSADIGWLRATAILRRIEDRAEQLAADRRPTTEATNNDAGGGAGTPELKRKRPGEMGG